MDRTNKNHEIARLKNESRGSLFDELVIYWVFNDSEEEIDQGRKKKSK